MDADGTFTLMVTSQLTFSEIFVDVIAHFLGFTSLGLLVINFVSMSLCGIGGAVGSLKFF